MKALVAGLALLASLVALSPTPRPLARGASVTATWEGSALPARAAPVPALEATWIAPGRVLVVWSGADAQACLYYQRPGHAKTFVERACGPSGAVELRAGYDASVRPEAGAIVTLEVGTQAAPLARVEIGDEPLWYAVILPIVVRQ
jgi:hypothetical protein